LGEDGLNDLRKCQSIDDARKRVNRKGDVSKFTSCGEVSPGGKTVKGGIVKAGNKKKIRGKKVKRKVMNQAKEKMRISRTSFRPGRKGTKSGE